jgi:hypothetical protein
MEVPGRDQARWWLEFWKYTIWRPNQWACLGFQHTKEGGECLVPPTLFTHPPPYCLPGSCQPGGKSSLYKPRGFRSKASVIGKPWWLANLVKHKVCESPTYIPPPSYCLSGESTWTPHLRVLHCQELLASVSQSEYWCKYSIYLCMEFIFMCSLVTMCAAFWLYSYKIC